MRDWLGYLLAFAALLCLAPLIGWLAHRHGRSIKGGIALASFMLGFAPIDPPSRRLIEATEKRVKTDEENGEPKAPRSDG